MIRHRSRAELKNEVKDLLRGNWKKAILLYLIPIIYVWITSGYNLETTHTNFQYNMTNFNTVGYSRFNFSYGIIGFIISILLTLITLSANFRGFDWLEDPELDFNPIKSNFTYFRSPDWWKLTIIYFITVIFTLLWSLLLVIPGIIKAFSYSQTFYVYKDLNDRGLTKGYSLTTYINKSRQLMMGNKWRYFVLQLSFIGWWIVGFITLGIGFIWILPYYRLTMVNFYRDLVEKDANYL